MNKIITILLLITLIANRILIRASNDFWIDEIAQIRNLTSVYHLVFEYLPFTPGVAPGHYFLTFPLNIFFPWNKYILGLPGLIGQILIFLLIPKLISRLEMIDIRSLSLTAFITRLCFVFDPVLAFQAMEVRPYSLLPLLWVLMVFVVRDLISFDKKRIVSFRDYLYIFKLIVFIVVAFIWHFYGLVIFLSLYFFFKRKMIFQYKNIFFKKSFLIFFISLTLALPVWLYFGQGSSLYKFKTFEFVPTNLIQYLFQYKEHLKGAIWISYIFLFLLMALFILAILGLARRFFSVVERSNAILIGQGLVFLVGFPIFAIFIIDLINPYWFLYRQFAWVALPFYLIVGSSISRFIR